MQRIIMKYGGTSISDPSKIERVAEIIKNFLKENPNFQYVIVASAMGNTTNKLESIFHLKCSAEWKDLAKIATDRILNEHIEKAITLGVVNGKIFHKYYSHLKKTLLNFTSASLQNKDAVLSCGELISTAILHEYFKKIGITCRYLDARNYIHTDSTFTNANVNWKITKQNFREIATRDSVLILQGFIGSDSSGRTTTLGRDGSDFSAAIAGTCLNSVEKVVLWKDVRGIYSKDPKQHSDAELLNRLSPDEAQHLINKSNVVHEKTVVPLQAAGITLQVRSFKEELFHDKGTLIQSN